MATAALSRVQFDYSATVFGEENIIDVDARTWGAVRMRRCLDSLSAVTGSVLEVGCGAGRCIRTIHHHRPDLEAFGCDLSERSIELAERHGDGIRYETADAAAMPYPDECFDAVVIMDLIEHVPDVQAVLAEVRRVSRPGATLHLHVPCEGSRLSLYYPLLMLGIDLTREAVGHLHHFTRRQVLDHLAKAGFAVLGRRYSMYLFGQLHDIIGWRTLLRRRRGAEGQQDREGAAAPLNTVHRQLGPRPRFHPKRLITRPAWWVVRTLLPVLQYLELRLLSRQPLGAVGLCITAKQTNALQVESRCGGVV